MTPPTLDARKLRMLSRQEEITTWQAWQDGDESARHRLIESNVAWAKGLAYRLARKLHLDHEECHAIALLVLVNSIDSYDARVSRLSTWVGKPIRWAIYRYRTQAGIACSRPADCPDGEARKAWKLAGFVKGLRDVHTYDANHDDAMELADVYEAIDKLPARQRQVVGMALDGNPYSTMARELGVSREACRQVYERAACRLRKGFCGAD
jgi:RNA polymerase sigma factor (sigma-70 family)